MFKFFVIVVIAVLLCSPEARAWVGSKLADLRDKLGS